MAYKKKMRPAPYLQKLQVRRLYSERKLAELSGVSRHAIRGIKAGHDARPETLEKLAAALDALPEDLTGERSADPAAHEAYLDHLFSEKKTLGPGDLIYDEHPTAGMTDLELGAYVRKNPQLRGMVDALVRQEEKRERLEAEGRMDAG